MKYEFEVYQMQVDEHLFWVAKSKVLKGCVGQGETHADAISELELNEQEWLETAQEVGITIPPITTKKENTFSGKISLRLSPLTHEECSSNASELGISLNQYLTDAISYYNGYLSGKKMSKTGIPQNMEVTGHTKNIIPFSQSSRVISTVTVNIDDMQEEM